jgi:putative phosphoribosyl transferase
MKPFPDRREAGRQLAAELTEYAHRSDVIVMAIPRGGVPVAFEVARALGAPLDVLLVRTVWAPGHDDIHIGTIADGGFGVLEPGAVDARVDPAIVGREMMRARADLVQQLRIYRGGRAAPALAGKTVIIVYDGIVSGASMRAAVASVRARGAAHIVVAAPVAAPNAASELAGIADECVCVATPEPFYRIAVWYDEFAPVTDASVLFLLDRAAMAAAGTAA